MLSYEYRHNTPIKCILKTVMSKTQSLSSVWGQNEIVLTLDLPPTERRSVSRAVEAGHLFQIREGVYTPYPPDGWTGVVARKRYEILASLFPGAVIGWKTGAGFSGGFPVDGAIYLSHSSNRVIELPGLKIVLIKGAPALAGDLPWLSGKLHIAGEARALLENLMPSRGIQRKTVTSDAYQAKLAEYLRLHGETKLNALRDQARSLAPLLGLENQFIVMDTIVSKLLATHPSLKKATIAKGPVDSARIVLLNTLAEQLRGATLRSAASVAETGDALTNFAFMESYFSNFIEGTKFTLDEAHDIAILGKPSPDRPTDAHDIIGVMVTAMNPSWRSSTLPHGLGAVGYLQGLHKQIMKNRDEVRPGEFKIKLNQAGNTTFVHPDLVHGTLIAATELLPTVPEGLPRALFATALLTEIHPFDDGNGRLARLAMNAELTRCGLSRIIVPTLIREEYLDCLRRFSRESDPAPFIKLMTRMQQWTAGFQYDDLNTLRTQMTETNAFEESPVNFKLHDPLSPSYGFSL